MSIQLKPTWKDGKTWEYKSDRVVHEKEEALPQLPTANSIVASHQKRHTAVSNSKHQEPVNSNECSICGETGEKSFWIGCSHKKQINWKTGLQLLGSPVVRWPLLQKARKSGKGSILLSNTWAKETER